MKKPLEGIKVLDLSRLLPGPYASMMLADMGAEVIKVEDTGLGDYFRTTQKDSFLTLNRNKKAMNLNLKDPKGKEIFLKLVEKYDVVLEQFRPGTMDKLGVGYEVCKKVNPGIIFCSLSGYGAYGPYRDLVGHDNNYLGLTGLLSSIHDEEGNPVIPGIYIGDMTSAAWAIISILTAVIGRQNNGGKGQFLDVAISDSLLTLLNCYAAAELYKGEFFDLTKGVAWYTSYRCKDGKYITVGSVEPKFWKGFCDLIGRSDFVENQTPKTDAEKAKLKSEIAEIMKTKTQAEWVELAGMKDICFSPVKTLKEAFADPHTIARKMIAEIDIPGEGKVKTIAYPVKFSETPFEASECTPPPERGAHTEEALLGVGYTKQEIEEFRKAGVI